MALGIPAISVSAKVEIPQLPLDIDASASMTTTKLADRAGKIKRIASHSYSTGTLCPPMYAQKYNSSKCGCDGRCTSVAIPNEFQRQMTGTIDHSNQEFKRQALWIRLSREKVYSKAVWH